MSRRERARVEPAKQQQIRRSFANLDGHPAENVSLDVVRQGVVDLLVRIADYGLQLWGFILIGWVKAVPLLLLAFGLAAIGIGFQSAHARAQAVVAGVAARAG